MFDKFLTDNRANTNLSQIVGYLDILKDTISTIDSQGALDAFKQDLTDIGNLLSYITKAQRAFDPFIHSFQCNYASRRRRTVGKPVIQEKDPRMNTKYRLMEERLCR